MKSRFQGAKANLLQLFRKARAVAKEKDMTNVESRLEADAQRLQEGLLYVVVSGEFKQGKSSLLGALLEDPELFPVETDIATSQLTMARYAEEEKITAVAGRPEPFELEISRDEIARYVTEKGNPENRLEVRLIQIETSNKHLTEGVVMVDTPGVSGIDPGHMEITLSLVPQADVVLFVSDSLAPLTQPELDFLRDHLAEATGELLFVVSKIDRVSEADADAIFDSNRRKIMETLGLPKEKISLFGVSSTSKLSFLETGDPEDLEDSGFQELEAELQYRLWELRGKIVLNQGFSRLDRRLNALEQRLNLERRACRERGQSESRRLSDEISRARKDKNKLLEPRADWRKILQAAFQATRQQILSDEWPMTRNRFQQWLDNELDQMSGSDDPEALLKRIERELVKVSAHLTKQAEQKIHQDCRRLPDHLQTDGTLNAFQKPASLHHFSPEVETDFWSDALDFGRQAGGGALAGGILGGGALSTLLYVFSPIPAVGALFASIFSFLSSTTAVGTLVGILAGLRKGWRDLFKNRKSKLKKEMLDLLRPGIEESFVQIKKGLRESLTTLQEAMSKALEEYIKQEQANLDKLEKDLKKKQQLTQEEAAGELKEIERQLKRVGQIRKEGVEILSQFVEGETPSAGSRA